MSQNLAYYCTFTVMAAVIFCPPRCCLLNSLSSLSSLHWC
nr:MAG TPA: hypothetical protein [Caudoviricetes sp.]